MNSLALILESCLKRTNSFIRFLLVGVVNTLTGLSIMILLLNIFGQSYWVSTFVGNSAGAMISYLLNRSFTFQSKGSIRTSAFRFITVILVCYLLSYFISHAIAGLIENVHLVRQYISKENLAIFIGAGLYTISNYFGQKLYVFKK